MLHANYRADLHTQNSKFFAFKIELLTQHVSIFMPKIECNVSAQNKKDSTLNFNYHRNIQLQSMIHLEQLGSFITFLIIQLVLFICNNMQFLQQNSCLCECQQKSLCCMIKRPRDVYHLLQDSCMFICSFFVFSHL